MVTHVIQAYNPSGKSKLRDALANVNLIVPPSTTTLYVDVDIGFIGFSRNDPIMEGAPGEARILVDRCREKSKGKFPQTEEDPQYRTLLERIVIV